MSKRILTNYPCIYVIFRPVSLIQFFARMPPYLAILNFKFGQKLHRFLKIYKGNTKICQIWSWCIKNHVDHTLRPLKKNIGNFFLYTFWKSFSVLVKCIFLFCIVRMKLTLTFNFTWIEIYMIFFYSGRTLPRVSIARLYVIRFSISWYDISLW